MRKASVFSVFCVLIAVGSAAAAGPTGPSYYFGLNLGVAADIDGQTFDVTGFGTGVDVDLQYGGTISGSIGYIYGNGWRVEGELTHTRANVDAIGTSAIAAELGEVRSTGLMVNGYYDFRHGQRFQPYVGLGLGALQTSYKGTSLSLGSGLVDFTDESTNSAGQLILGLGYWVSDRVSLSAEYRYVTTLDDAKYTLSDGNLVKERFDLHRVMVGLRYTF